MIILVVVAFLNEERYLPEFLASLRRQTRPPDRVLLVDDGSTDASPEIAARFAAETPGVSVLRRPRRPSQPDRLDAAPEWRAFQWALEQVDLPHDVVAKMDADIDLPEDTFAHIEAKFESDARLGLTGPYLSILLPDGSPLRERCPPGHIRGATKFYRRACYEEILPIPATLGWDTIDEVKARFHGWTTTSFALPSGDPIHLRPTGMHGGGLRMFRRLGLGAHAYGAHPVHVVLGALSRLFIRPPLVGSVTYIAFYVLAGVRGDPRVEPEIRAYVRGEQLARLRRRMPTRRRVTSG